MIDKNARQGCKGLGGPCSRSRFSGGGADQRKSLRMGRMGKGCKSALGPIIAMRLGCSSTSSSSSSSA
eukprot:7847619-Pyramimonas_sp.AAC.1